MNRAQRMFLATALAVVTGLTSFIPITAHADGLTDALTSGTVKVNLRYRWENVDNGSANEANASTLRTRLGYASGAFSAAGMENSLYVEFENVTDVGSDNYAPEVAGYPTVADPTGSEVNQAFLQVKGLSDTALRLGRQRVKLDNDRHVGNVGWRQNEQTYDALTLVNTHFANLTLTYGFVWMVNTITFSDTDTATHLLNANYKGLGPGSLSAYAYFLDLKGTSSHKTFGARYTGGADLGGMGLLYTAEYADQSDYADGASSVDANYLFAELGAQLQGITGKLGYEVLGGDGTYGFSTPLATKHAFNGWADQFLATPAVGLVDTMFTLSGKVAGIDLAGVYHDFQSDSGSTDFGTEIDLLAKTKLGDHYLVGVKYASFNADAGGGFSDVDKYWLFAEMAF